jgi:hypothetical protein
MNEAAKSRRNVWSDLSQGRPNPDLRPSRVPRGRDQCGDNRCVRGDTYRRLTNSLVDALGARTISSV